MKKNYDLLNNQAQALLEGINYNVTLLSNASALLNMELENINWVGFYYNIDNKLILGPFQGKVACTEIQIGKGVCGSSLLKDETILVSNVHEFEGHIACDSASNSEIVIPVHKDGKIYALLDIDSPLIARFDEEDKLGLENFVKIIEKLLK